jgi:hypothetical protein
MNRLDRAKLAALKKSKPMIIRRKAPLKLAELKIDQEPDEYSGVETKEYEENNEPKNNNETENNNSGENNESEDKTETKVEPVREEKIIDKIYTNPDGSQYTYKLEKRTNRRRDGTVTERIYPIKKNIKQNKQKRGPKVLVEKKRLKELLPDLSESECAKLMRYYEEHIKEPEVEVAEESESDHAEIENSD